MKRPQPPTPRRCVMCDERPARPRSRTCTACYAYDYYHANQTWPEYERYLVRVRIAQRRVGLSGRQKPRRAAKRTRMPRRAA